MKDGRKYILFNDTLNTFYFQLYGVGHMIKHHSAKMKTHYHHLDYSFQLAARILLYAPSNRQDKTYHSLCYTGWNKKQPNGSTMRDRSDDPSHQQQKLHHGATSSSLSLILKKGNSSVRSKISPFVPSILNFRVRIRVREREMFYLMTHSTHFIYGYMASDIWLRTILIVRKETRCRHIGYSC